MAQNDWDQTEELASRHESSGSLWLKLVNDKDKIKVVFLGAPFARDVCFLGGKYVLCDEKLQAEGHKPVFRMSINVAILETREVKIFEQGRTFYGELKQVRTKYGLEKRAFEVIRHGAARDPNTHYSIHAEPNDLSVSDQKIFQELKLHDLRKLHAANGAQQALDSYDQRAQAPAASVVTPELAGRLKSLPREAVDRFLSQLNVQRIKDVAPSQLQAAMAIVQQLERENGIAPHGDIDPFE